MYSGLFFQKIVPPKAAVETYTWVYRPTSTVSVLMTFPFDFFTIVLVRTISFSDSGIA